MAGGEWNPGGETRQGEKHRCIVNKFSTALIPGVCKSFLPQAIQDREEFLELIIALAFAKQVLHLHLTDRLWSQPRNVMRRQGRMNIP